MSKRVPVYLSEEELKTLIAKLEGKAVDELNPYQMGMLIERLKEELERSFPEEDNDDN